MERKTRSFEYVQTKSGNLTHPKMRFASELLKISVSDTAGLVATLWWACAKLAPNGNTNIYTPKAWAEICGWRKKPSADRIFEVLRMAPPGYDYGFIEDNGFLHDWEEHQPILRERESDKMRKREIREEVRSVSSGSPTDVRRISGGCPEDVRVVSGTDKEKEKEKEKEKKRERNSSVEEFSSKQSFDNKISPEKLLKIFREINEKNILPQPALAITDVRRKHLIARCNQFKNKPGLFVNWCDAVRKAVNEISWDWGWRPNFDWFIVNDTNFLKVLEGKYDKPVSKSKLKEIFGENESKGE